MLALVRVFVRKETLGITTDGQPLDDVQAQLRDLCLSGARVVHDISKSTILLFLLTGARKL